MTAASWGGSPSPVPAHAKDWSPVVLMLNRNPEDSSLGMTFKSQRLIAVSPVGAAWRAGANDVIGRQLTHINDIPVNDQHDIERLSISNQLKFRFAPVSAPDNSPAPGGAGSTAAKDVIEQPIVVVLSRAQKAVPLGIDLREPGLTLEKVDPGSPAAEFGLQRLIGHRLTHCGGRYVLTTSDVMLASEGLSRVEMSFQPWVAGAAVRREHSGISWGFAVNGANLEIIKVEIGSPGDTSGLTQWLGHHITHVNGRLIDSSQDLAVALQTSPNEIHLRFCPWSVEELAHLPLGGPRIEEVEVFVRPDTSIGLSLHPDMVLENVAPGSPADEAGLQEFFGWRLTHVEGRFVGSIDAIFDALEGQEAAWFRFAELPPESQLSPEEVASENINVQRYREWLKRRTVDRDQARQPSVRGAPPRLQSPRYIRSPIFRRPARAPRPSYMH
ncbi:hypothetical protein DIPPA_29618 [Diplonema papillatum]|nr:hypothetical protein DIPPA_29618 [Diplonema papillatum]